jgi:hypothetical protein
VLLADDALETFGRDEPYHEAVRMRGLDDR